MRWQATPPPAPLYPAAYYDTVAMLLRRRVKYGEWVQRLTPLCLGKVFPGETKAKGWRKLVMQQPTDAALELVAGVPSDMVKLQRVDVALDLLTRDRADRDRLVEWLAPRLLQRWNRGARRAVKGTTYTGPGKWRTRTTVMYADKPCRIDGETPCVHLEVRALGAKQVRAMGWETAADLLATDWHALWARHLCLKEPDPVAMRRQHVRNRPGGDAGRAVGLLLRASQTDGLCAAAQDVGEFCRAWSWRQPHGWLDARTALRTVPVRALLPPAA